MIVRPRPSPLRLLFVVRGTILPRVLPHVLGIATLSCLVVWASRQSGLRLPIASPAPLSLLGIALSIFLGFRNNASYDRWWEARKVWGSLLIELRAFSHEAITLLDDGRAELPLEGRRTARRLVHRNIAFAHALAAHLRGHDAAEDISRYVPEPERSRVLTSRNRPNALLREHAGELAALRRNGRLADIPWGSLNERVHALMSVLTASERIRSTPVPFTYTVLLHRTAYLFCLLLPFGIAEALGWFTPVLAAMVAYTFFGLDRLSDELEEPFGNAPNDLPLLALARTAEMNLLEALGEPQPEPLQPRDFILP
ncbi:bestrophin family protein [Pyxidicoccus caerfyrddinensis]|uniref:bestrophin family protein n=1 Tax=Pyxidicoccus caerfyrddinensis TaxID=2709663 RepID=UPI0013DC6B7E|nr:bestrophin family protein [Pyxidicoccus caerfyrddinensis]